MKIIFSKSVAKFANWAQAISLFFFLVLFFSSCKKEILTDKKPDELVTAATGSSIKQISYTDFLQRVDLNKIGNIGKVFKISPKESLLKTDVMGNQDYQFEIETSQVMEVKLNGHISYVFPLKLSSKYARNFSNLTIDIKDGTVKTFINTYTPTDKWISDWKQKRVVGGFEGEVSYQVIPNSFDFLKPSTSTMSTNCFFWTETYLEPYPCQGSGDQRHMPWEYCPWAGQSNGPGYALTTRMKSVCISGGGGGGTGGEGDPIGGGGGTGDPITNPFPPSTYQPCGQPPSRPRPGVPPCEEPTLVEHLIYNLGITDATQINYLNSPLRRPLVEQLSDYLHVNVGSQDSQNYARWAIAYLIVNQSSVNINQFLTEFFPVGVQSIADPNADNWTEPDNEILFDPDQTVYQQYQDNQPWPTVNRVIDFEKFVPLRQVMTANGQLRDVNCLVLAREQLGKVGYTCSGYLPGGQTFSIFTTQNGVDLVETKKAISYIISSLSQKIPVLIGVDNRPGAPSANLDNSTDHYVVIVGMGTDEKGKYFQFMDSATENRSTGASYNNRLYYDSITGKITGKTAIVGYRSQPGMRDYTVTQVRKSIKK